MYSKCIEPDQLFLETVRFQRLQQQLRPVGTAVKRSITNQLFHLLQISAQLSRTFPSLIKQKVNSAESSRSFSAKMI